MKNLVKFLILTLLFGGMVATFSCSDDDEDPQPKSTATDIITFSLADQIGDAVIDAAKHSVDVEVAATRDITILRPYLTLSLGATAAPASGTEGDYSSPVTITVTAEDNTTTENWTVTVTEAAAPGTTLVVFGDGGTKATAITDLVVNGVTYDVKFVFQNPGQVYGPYPETTFTFPSSDSVTALRALDEINVALNDAGAVNVGEVGKERLFNKARIGYETFELATVPFVNFRYTVFKDSVESWENWNEPEDTPFNEKVLFAEFTEK
jgi:hypothetical protein